MDHYTAQQRAEMIKWYYQNNSSVVRTQRVFRRKYGAKSLLSKRTIRKQVEKFEKTGNVTTSRPTIYNRKRRSAEVISAVQADVEEHPDTSCRRRAQQFGMHPSTLWTILKTDLKMFPYKVQMVQQLLLSDKPRRIQYAANMNEILTTDANYWQHVIMTDEAHFTLCGSVNTQNCRFWGTQNPQLIHEEPLHSPKVTVWCGVSANKIIGPYFFEDENGKTATVNGERYRAMITTFLAPQIVENHMEDYWFQQDGATCHTAGETMRLLQTFFPGRLISKNGDFDWPPRSPDLTPPDFFLWGYLKGRVYATRPETLEQLKGNICREINAIPVYMLQKVMDNARKRAQLCVAAKGGHLADIVFKK